MWIELADCLSKLRDNTLDMDDPEQLKQRYRACLGWKIAHTRIVSATTTNARSPFFRKNWARDDRYGAKCKGVVIQIDEAAKEFELNLYIAIVEETWDVKVVGLILLGDTR